MMIWHNVLATMNTKKVFLIKILHTTRQWTNFKEYQDNGLESIIPTMIICKIQCCTENTFYNLM
jgi:hypothetical protein